jgi:serine/threonine protein kinase
MALLTSNDFQIKLADFGFARILQDGEKMNDFFGTLAYMAPEIICK